MPDYIHGESINTSSVEAVTRSAGSFYSDHRDPGAHAPGFMLSCAPRTVPLKNPQSS
jgi:hypothetical protein